MKPTQQQIKHIASLLTPLFRKMENGLTESSIELRTLKSTLQKYDSRELTASAWRVIMTSPAVEEIRLCC